MSHGHMAPKLQQDDALDKWDRCLQQSGGCVVDSGYVVDSRYAVALGYQCHKHRALHGNTVRQDRIFQELGVMDSWNICGIFGAPPHFYLEGNMPSSSSTVSRLKMPNSRRMPCNSYRAPQRLRPKQIVSFFPPLHLQKRYLAFVPPICRGFRIPFARLDPRLLRHRLVVPTADGRT